MNPPCRSMSLLDARSGRAGIATAGVGGILAAAIAGGSLAGAAANGGVAVAGFVWGY
jgi:hypothetical protein